jgi:hypothetical protein
MNEQMDPLVFVVKVKVAHPYLLHGGVVAPWSVAFLVRFFLRNIVSSVTGGVPEIEVLHMGYTIPETGECDGKS